MDGHDIKRTKFSPSTIDQMESDTVSRLCGSVDRYAVPESFKGKEPGPWEMLHSQFPAPSDLQDAAQLHLFQLNYRGCPLYYTCMQCSCPNCTDMQRDYIPYAHSVIYDQELNAISTPGKPRVMIDQDMFYVRPNDIDVAIANVLHHAHYYEGYVVCSHSTALQTCPETPIFSRVLFQQDDSENTRIESLFKQTKWASRSALTPTRLVFKETD